MPTFTLNDLAARVKERAAASPETSYTRKLLDRGVAQCAKKLFGGRMRGTHWILRDS